MEFWGLPLDDANVRNVLLGVLPAVFCTALAGSFAVLRKRSLSGDAVAHAVLPGVCVAYLITGSKSPVYIALGAFITGMLSLYITDAISRRTKIKPDGALTLVLSVFFGVGIMLLTYIQHSGTGAQSGLNTFLFGQAATMSADDALFQTVVFLCIALPVPLFFKELKTFCFDREFALTAGMPIKFLEAMLTGFTVAAVVAGIQTIGVVMVAAMLVTPATAALFVTSNFKKAIALSLAFAAMAGLAGTWLSYTIPGMPTGPWIVLFATGIALICFMLSPEKGLLAQWYRKNRVNNKITDENILKLMYRLGEDKCDFYAPRTVEEMQNRRRLPNAIIHSGLRRLRNQGFMERKNNSWIMTKEGKEKGRKITKAHRLWEMYLTRYLSLPQDHVHDNSETMEHLITPDIEKRLEEMLGYPTHDPHGEKIPYQ